MSTFRKRLLVDEWVIIARERARRPREIETVRTSEAGPCPFCPAHESVTPQPVGNWDSPEYPDHPWGVRAVPNKYPALRVEHEFGDPGDETDLYQSRGGLGAHEVLIEAPVHITEFDALSGSHLARVLVAWRTRLDDLSRDQRLRCAVLFKNSGAAAGATIEHVHSQLMGFPFVPSALRRKIQGSRDYFEKTGDCPICEMLALELETNVRIVAGNDAGIAVAPYASRMPFELWIVPTAHSGDFRRAEDTDLEHIAKLLAEVLPKWNRATGGADYNFVLHSLPFDLGDEPYYHWHLELIPRTGRMAGLEWGSNVFINATPSEVAADHLRNLTN